MIQSSAYYYLIHYSDQWLYMYTMYSRSYFMIIYTDINIYVASTIVIPPCFCANFITLWNLGQNSNNIIIFFFYNHNQLATILSNSQATGMCFNILIILLKFKNIFSSSIWHASCFY